MTHELDQYRSVLFGRKPLPEGISVNHIEALLEYASTVFARSKEMEMLIHRGERDGTIMKGGSHYRFRTGELRAFQEISKSSAELGSRRVTLAIHEADLEEY